MKLTPAEKAGLSPAEIAALESADAETALATMGDTPPEPGTIQAADDADQDNSDDTDTGAEGASSDGADAAGAGDDQAKDDADGTLTAEQLAAIAAEGQPAQPAKPTTYEVPERNFAAERKALRDERKALQAKWDAGELDDAQLEAQQDAVDDKLDALAREQARADTLRELNEQHAREAAARLEAEENDATIAVIKAAKAAKVGAIDYVADKAAQSQFDMALGMLKADPANSTKTPTQLVQQAHRAVLAVRGINAEPAPNPSLTPTATPRQPQPRNVPQSLAGLPNAGIVPLQDETLAQAQRLNGEDLEQFLARLTPAQQAKLLRNVDNQAAVH